MQNKAWRDWKFALATKNSVDDRREMTISDVEIDSIKISELDAADMYPPEVQEKERNWLLQQKYAVPTEDGMAQEADLARIFELNIAHKMAAEQRKDLALLEEEDSDEEILFKHYETLKRYRYNIKQFNEQVLGSIRDEDEQMSHLLSSTHLQGAQLLLEDVYRGSKDMAGNLKGLMDMTRTTIEGIGSATGSAADQKKAFDVNQVELGNDVFKAMVQSHTVLDLLISELEDMVHESDDFLDNFAEDLES